MIMLSVSDVRTDCKLLPWRTVDYQVSQHVVGQKAHDEVVFT